MKIERCPICHNKLVFICQNDDVIGDECKNGHFQRLDYGLNGGFYVRIGKREIKDLYSSSERICRLQNKVMKNWIMRERKVYKK